MKTLIIVIALLLPTIMFAQRDLPPEKFSLDGKDSIALVDRDTSNIYSVQVMIRNDTVAIADTIRFYEIIDGKDTIPLRVKASRTGIEDTVVAKNGLAQDYEFVKPIIGVILARLRSQTSIDLYFRKRKTF